MRITVGRQRTLRQRANGDRSRDEACLPQRLVLGGTPGQSSWINRNVEGKQHAVIALPSCLHCLHPHTSSLPQFVDAYFWQSCTGQQAVEVTQKALGGEEVTRRRAEDEILVLPALTCVCAPRLLVPVGRARLTKTSNGYPCAAFERWVTCSPVKMCGVYVVAIIAFPFSHKHFHSTFRLATE